MEFLQKKIYAIFYLIVVFGCNNITASDSIINFLNQDSYIGRNLFIFEDETSELALQQVQDKEFVISESDVPNLGISNSTFWIRFNVTNETNEEELMLNLALPTLDEVVFYYKTEAGVYDSIVTGENLPFNNRKYDEPNYLFDLLIEHGQTEEIYFKISSKEAIQLPITIASKTKMFNHIKRKEILSGLYFGIMLVMILYNLFVYLLVRDKSYLYYIGYIVLILLTQTSLQGYPFQFLWPNSPKIAQYGLFIFPSLVGIASMVFMNVFLRVKTHSVLLFKMSMVLSIPYAISIILAVLGFFKASFTLMEINAGIVSVYIMITAIKIVRNGFQPAKYFLIAWTIFLVGVIIYILKDLGILPFNNFTRYTMQIGSGIETILLSFALAARINFYKKEKEASQQKTVEVLKENEKIIKEQNIVLEQNVEKRTKDLNQTLKDLKQAQSKLVDSEKMSSLGLLTAGIAHEINNPINFVSSSISPLRQDLDDIKTILAKYEEIGGNDNVEEKLRDIKQLKERLDYDIIKTELETIVNGIEDGAKRTAEIVSGLRNFSRLDEGELKSANINEGINSTLILIKNKLNGISIVKNLGDLPNIECYPGKLNQLFLNLVDNAIGAIISKEMNTSEGEIGIKTWADREFLYIEVSDNGIGIKKEIKDKIFEPFFTSKEVGSGTGLGLSIAYSIVESHNGEITVESEENIGTQIKIALPLNSK